MAQWKRCVGQSLKWDWGGCTNLPALLMFTNAEVIRAHCCFRTQSPAHSRRDWWVALKEISLGLCGIQLHLRWTIQGLYQKSPHYHKLTCDQKDLVMNNKRHSYYSGNSKSLEALCQEVGMKTNFLFCHVNRYQAYENVCAFFCVVLSVPTWIVFADLI